MALLVAAPRWSERRTRGVLRAPSEAGKAARAGPTLAWGEQRRGVAGVGESRGCGVLLVAVGLQVASTSSGRLAKAGDGLSMSR